ncbi:uncharacterized protein PAN0_001d0653 [Moesziomyces antarcticus]|uniref:Chromatin assembly factor 1 subunit A dimerization domain-containing protein n=1 Tax=Pseudozyma antarctica TaxID=84753 RepID=A0A5C3FF74_PSEA2|nr:uncharacterized protein PAN0_001d0653 [Moesziomyces antarcticus]GAK62453.1 conserved hypothetical protein [Moesziomyces antarcticus]SPO43008.1 uncharacterized protein PSANT_00692 [Moesziomyces antarcticus]
MSVLAPPPSPSPSSCFDAMLSDTDINIDRAMPPTSLKRKASSTKSRAAAATHASSSDAENRPLIQSSSASTIAKPKRAAGVADMAPSKSASTSSPAPAAKKAKLTSSAALVELRNGKLVLKQKPFNWASTMPVLKAVITFQEFLDVHEKLDSIPQDHLHVIAKLAQESDKSLVELAKAIRSKILPEADLGSSESDDSATSGAGAKAKLPLSCIQAAISAVAERRNYGIDAAIAGPHASSSDAADAVAVPAPLQLWRWEVTDLTMLPSEFIEKLLQRRSERESARTQAEQLFSSLTEQEKQALLSKSTKAKISATVAADAQVHTPAGSSASQPIAIDDDNDDGSVADTEHDRKAAQAPSTPVASRKRKSPSSTSTPQSTAKSSAMAGDTSASATSSPREKKRAKDAVELSPEKQKEKEEKDAAKAERLKAKEAKRLEREAKELEKQKAKEAKEAEQKKAEELKQRQVNFFTSFVKKAAPKSPSKSVVTAAASSTASGKPAEDVSDFDRTFLPCQYKDLAPINRFASRSGSKPELEMGQDDLSRDEMLSQFLTRASALSGNAGTRARRRKGVHPPASVREIKRVVTESDVLGGNAQEQAEKALETLQDRGKVQMKLLQFESDRRPGWYGTWTKSTNLISPRCPLGQDPVSLDYSYDSDADWEELGQVEGEDVQDGEEEKEDSVGDSDEDSEMDDWLVDDLEVEEEEEQARSAANAMDVDDEIVEVDKLGMPVPAQPVTTNLLHPKKKKKVKLLGRRFDAKLVPFSTGPHWESEFGRCDYDLFSSYRIELLNDACFGLNPFTFTSAEPASSTSEPDEAGIVDTPTKPRRGLPAGGVLAALWGDVAVASDAPPAHAAPAADKPEAAAPTAFKHQLHPDAIAPLLARIHGSTKTRAGLVDDLKEMLDQLAMPASKNAIGERLTAYATKEKKPNAPWVVKPAFAHLLPS